MIRHIVMFKFKDFAEGSDKATNLQIAKEKLQALQGVCPTLLRSMVKLGAEGSDETNYDLVLIAEYANMEALNAYIVHPAHQKVGEFMRAVRESRACIDFEF